MFTGGWGISVRLRPMRGWFEFSLVGAVLVLAVFINLLNRVIMVLCSRMAAAFVLLLLFPCGCTEEVAVELGDLPVLDAGVGGSGVPLVVPIDRPVISYDSACIIYGQADVDLYLSAASGDTLLLSDHVLVRPMGKGEQGIYDRYGKFSVYRYCMFLMKYREGYRKHEYLCPAGKRTVGFGSRPDLDAIGGEMGYEEATDHLRAKFEQYRDSSIVNFPNLEYHQHCAVAVLAHNIGWRKLCSYKLYDRLKEGRSPDIHWRSISKYRDKDSGEWVTSSNLLKSRKLELLLYNGDFEKAEAEIERLRPKLIKKLRRSGAFD